METIIKRMVFALLGLALIFIAYLLAGGQDRLMPRYGFPEPAFGCGSGDVSVRPNKPPPQLSRGYRQSELLWCYPPQNYPFYALATLGMIISGWALIITVKEKSLNAMSAFLMSVSMIFTGVNIFKLELELVGGSTPDPPDVFNSLALVLLLVGLLVGIFGVVSLGANVIKSMIHKPN